ncbi:MarR family transcriptional regulator [Paenibacillus sp. PR3]|uniref:MarR family transcriptional regulator n=1 Tax=Paenibacillus terricola TaxID=2763503 RepID=A0ABR8MYA0_9BACL|nr:MarR family transcriptional regulator [Paenibacillus terricola]MBD3920853.1 MarR family transcriptional regulator [Paenibacillus terricola]
MDKEQLSKLIDRYLASSFTVNRRLSAITRDLLPDELTLDQSAALRYLRDNGCTTSSELAEIFCVGKSSITAIITRLSDKSLIERVPDEKDRRVTYLKATPEGERLTRQFDSKLEEMLCEYLSHFTDQEAFGFIELYEKLAAALVQARAESESEENR